MFWPAPVAGLESVNAESQQLEVNSIAGHFGIVVTGMYWVDEPLGEN
jgi:hypothetical protein